MFSQSSKSIGKVSPTYIDQQLLQRNLCPRRAQIPQPSQAMHPTVAPVQPELRCHPRQGIAAGAAKDVAVTASRGKLVSLGSKLSSALFLECGTHSHQAHGSGEAPLHRWVPQSGVVLAAGPGTDLLRTALVRVLKHMWGT